MSNIKINETRMGWEIGQGTQLTTRFIWHACIDCGKERWIRYVVKEARPQNLRCRLCGIKWREAHRKPVQLTVEQRRHISEAKMGAKNPMFGKHGKKHSAWRGGRNYNDGYILISINPNDFFYPMADNSGYIREHRLIMAKHLCRCLLAWEVVHHKNGVRDDNRIENLELITDKRYHMIDASVKSYIKKLETRIRKLTENSTKISRN